jgi:hypothetical protein
MAESKTKGRLYLFGTPIAWIAVYGALVGVTSLVPVLPYAGGGGFWPLATPLAGIAPLILGPVGGIAAAFVGGIIGMFISPPAYPLGIIDAVAVVVLPSIFVGLALNMKKYKWIFLAWQVIMTVIFFVVLYYYPGVVGGWPPIPESTFFISTLYYWLLPIVVLLSPIGTKYIYNWARSTNPRQRTIGVFLGTWMAMNGWYTSPSYWIYWILFAFPSPLLYLMAWGIYTWYMPVFAILMTIITVPITEALRRSGMAKPPEVLW